MDEPSTNPSGSNPASPSRTYSETDRSELKTAASSAPAVCDSLPLAASGSQVLVVELDWLENNGIECSLAVFSRYVTPPRAMGCTYAYRAFTVASAPILRRRLTQTALGLGTLAAGLPAA